MRATESIRFCITMVDYKMHSQKISALATPKKGVIFHVENWCRMKGPPQYVYHTSDHHCGEKVLCPALHRLALA